MCRKYELVPDHGWGMNSELEEPELGSQQWAGAGEGGKGMRLPQMEGGLLEVWLGRTTSLCRPWSQDKCVWGALGKVWDSRVSVLHKLVLDFAL